MNAHSASAAEKRFLIPKTGAFIIGEWAKPTGRHRQARRRLRQCSAWRTVIGAGSMAPYLMIRRPHFAARYDAHPRMSGAVRYRGFESPLPLIIEISCSGETCLVQPSQPLPSSQFYSHCNPLQFAAWAIRIQIRLFYIFERMKAVKNPNIVKNPIRNPPSS